MDTDYLFENCKDLKARFSTELPKIRGLSCSYCGRFIEEGKKAYNDRIHCAVFCSLEHLALYTINRQGYSIVTLDSKTVEEDFGVEWEEV